MSDAADVLYAADPEEFVTLRKGLAAEARAAGDRAAATQIAGLGKPTRSAWIVNRLVRADPSVATRLGELGEQLRSGEASLDGASIRKLSVARRELIDSLVRAAVAQAGEPVSAAVRDEVAGTFNAALADPDVATQVAAGSVVKAVQWAGFSPGVGTALDPAAAFQLGPAAAPARSTPARSKSARSKSARSAPARPAATPEEKRAQQRTAAEQAVAEATAAAETAAAAEREQQEAVRMVVEQNAADQERLAQSEHALADAHQELARAQRAIAQAEQDQADAEQRLIRSRQSLVRERDRLKTAGTAARQTAAALKRSQQAFDRLR